MSGQTIDLTGNDPHLRFVEILTDAGIVRIDRGLVSTHGGTPVIMVTVEMNDEYHTRTEPGGVWAAEVREHPSFGRTDIQLTRQHVEVPR